MKKLIHTAILFAAFLGCVASVGAYAVQTGWIAHSGPTDANGCHYDANRIWHCH